MGSYSFSSVSLSGPNTYFLIAILALNCLRFHPHIHPTPSDAYDIQVHPGPGCYGESACFNSSCIDIRSTHIHCICICVLFRHVKLRERMALSSCLFANSVRKVGSIAVPHLLSYVPPLSCKPSTQHSRGNHSW